MKNKKVPNRFLLSSIADWQRANAFPAAITRDLLPLQRSLCQ